jgi:hypothetical protein
VERLDGVCDFVFLGAVEATKVDPAALSFAEVMAVPGSFDALPRACAGQLADVREMVGTSRNHPSVILWGILNEGHSHQIEARPAYERLLGELRRLDATRPVTYASMFGYNDASFDLCDVVSVNTYPGGTLARSRPLTPSWSACSRTSSKASPTSPSS